MQNANRKLAKMGKQMQRVGTGLTIGLTAPIVALGVKSVIAFDKQAKAIAQVEAGIKSTGGAAGRTSQELQDMATALQGTTLFGDDDILKDVTAQLLTFTNIAGKQFDRTQMAALNLATRLDGDLKSASIQLGKALNDPVANLSALSRSGIQFSTEQKAVIKSLVETNKLAEAQTIILNELENQYGGAAEAAANSGTGAFKQLSNILGDITEDFGEIITEAILPFVAKIKELAQGFQSLSPQTKKFIAILAGVAAAAGPLLALAGTILPAIGTGLALLTGPIGLVVAGLVAVGVAIYKNWAPIKKTLVDIANYFVDLYNESTIFRLGIDAIILTFKNMWEAAKFVFNAIVSILKSVVDSFINNFKTIGKAIKAALTFDTDLMQEAISDFANTSKNTIGTLIQDLAKDFKGFSTGISDNIKDAINGGGARAHIVLTEEQIDTTAIATKVKKAIEGATGPAALPTATGVNALTPGNFSADIGQQAGIDNTEELIAEADALEEKWLRLQAVAQAVGAGVADAFTMMSTKLVDSLGLADTGFQGFVKGLIGTITKLIAMMLAGSLANVIEGSTAAGTATGPLAVVTTPAFIATAVSGVMAAFGAIPKFATGGVITGETLAVVGDNPNARFDPEIIAPLSKLRDYMNPAGAGNTQISLGLGTKILGNDLELIIDRVLAKKLRY